MSPELETSLCLVIECLLYPRLHAWCWGLNTIGTAKTLPSGAFGGDTVCLQPQSLFLDISAMKVELRLSLISILNTNHRVGNQ